MYSKPLAVILIAAAFLPSAAATCAADLCYSSTVEDQGADCTAENGRRTQSAAVTVGDGSLLTVGYDSFCDSYTTESESGEDSYIGVTLASAQLFGAFNVNWYGHDSANGADECRISTTLETFQCPDGVDRPPFVMLPLP